MGGLGGCSAKVAFASWLRRTVPRGYVERVSGNTRPTRPYTSGNRKETGGGVVYDNRS
jgi:hypothetical protein